MAIVAAMVPGNIGLDYLDIKLILNSHKILKFVAIDDIYTFAKESQRMGINDICFIVCDGNKEYGMLDFLDIIDDYMDRNCMLAHEAICAMCYAGEIYPPKLYLFMC